jgi:hypothetical protein
MTRNFSATESREAVPVLGVVIAKEFEHGTRELSACGIGFSVRGVLVHDPHSSLDLRDPDARPSWNERAAVSLCELRKS